jgi:hypothetical protein
VSLSVVVVCLVSGRALAQARRVRPAQERAAVRIRTGEDTYDDHVVPSNRSAEQI